MTATSPQQINNRKNHNNGIEEAMVIGHLGQKPELRYIPTSGWLWVRIRLPDHRQIVEAEYLQFGRNIIWRRGEPHGAAVPTKIKMLATYFEWQLLMPLLFYLMIDMPEGGVCDCDGGTPTKMR